MMMIFFIEGVIAKTKKICILNRFVVNPNLKTVTTISILTVSLSAFLYNTGKRSWTSGHKCYINLYTIIIILLLSLYK